MKNMVPKIKRRAFLNFEKCSMLQFQTSRVKTANTQWPFPSVDKRQWTIPPPHPFPLFPFSLLMFFILLQFYYKQTGIIPAGLHVQL